GDYDSDLAEYEGKAKALPTQTVPQDILDEYLRTDSPTLAIHKQIEEIDLKIAEYPGKYPKNVADNLIRTEEATRAALVTRLEQRRKTVLPEIEARHRGKIK